MTKQSLGLRKSRLFYMFYSILRKRGRANFDTASGGYLLCKLFAMQGIICGGGSFDR
jgi:hypothetical protein